jgi:hypothetical protein
MRPDNTLPIRLTHRPTKRPSKRRAFHPSLGLTQVNSQFRREFRPYMKSLVFVVQLKSLGLFMQHWNIDGKEQIGRIVNGLQRDPLHAKGVNVLRLLQFVWSTTSIKLARKKLTRKKREYWDPIEVAEILSRHTYLRKLVDEGRVTSITMKGQQGEARLTIRLSHYYDTKRFLSISDIMLRLLEPEGVRISNNYSLQNYGFLAECMTAEPMWLKRVQWLT